jgi:hypothetical protein
MGTGKQAAFLKLSPQSLQALGKQVEILAKSFDGRV